MIKGKSNNHEIKKMMKIKILFIICALLIGGLGLITVFSQPMEESDSRTTHPPGQPKNPSPGDGATGLTGPSIKLTWQQTEVYRGAHEDIDNTWLKISTLGPCNSDSATGNIYDGEIGSAKSHQISGEKVIMDTIYYWAVKCHDEDGWGQYSNWKFTTNAKPVASITSITPSSAREGREVEFEGEGTDTEDNDDIIEYKWESSIDGIISDERQFSSLELENPLTSGIHRITFSVMDENELWSDVTDQCQRNLEIKENTPPSKPVGIKVDGDTKIDDQELTTHELEPRITWSPSSDPDPEDEREIKYIISISATPSYEKSIANEVPLSLPEYTINQELSYGDLDEYTNTMANIYYMELYSTDGYKNSEIVLDSFKVVNHPPDSPNIELQLNTQSSSETLSCIITKDNPSPSRDSDGDRITYTYMWYRNGEIQSGLSGVDKKQIPGTELNHFDTWKVEVIPNDSFVDGEVAEASIKIPNKGPNAVIKLSDPEFPSEGYYTWEEITFDATGTKDPDGDYIRDSFYTWESNISGELGKSASLINNLEPGLHQITLTVSDDHGATSNITTTIRVLESPYLVIPILSLADDVDRDKIDVGDKIGLVLRIENRGTETIEKINISFTNQDLPETSLEKIAIDSIAANISYTKIIDDYEVTKPLVNLKLVIQSSNRHDHELSEERGELLYTEESLLRFNAKTKTESDDDKMGKIMENWYWWLLIILIVLLIIAGSVLLLLKGKGKEEEEPEMVGPMGESSKEERVQPGYSVRTSDLSGEGAGMGAYPYGGPLYQHPALPMPAPYPGYSANAYLPPGPMGFGANYQQLALPAGQGFGGTGYPESDMSYLPGISEFQRGPPSGYRNEANSYQNLSDLARSTLSEDLPVQSPKPPKVVEKKAIKPKTIDAELLDESESEDELQESPSCPNCGSDVEDGWLLCPECKCRLQ